MPDRLDVNDYQGRMQQERANVTEQYANGEYRVPRKQDRDDLKRFAGDLHANLSPSTASDDLARVRRIAELDTPDKPLRECDVDDIKLGISTLAERNLEEKHEYEPGTKRKYLQAFERFGRSRNVDALADIDVPSVEVEDVDPDRYPEKHEFWAMLEEADRQRDRAMIATMWEAPSRITAFLSLKVKNYEEPNDEYALLTTPVHAEGLKGAGGQMKPITLARGDLEQWLSQHPCRDDPEAALFCRLDAKDHYGEHMTDNNFRKIMNDLADEIELDKPVHPHAFRHSRASYMKASDKYDDMHIEQMLDWSEGTQQHTRYEHVDQTEKVNSLLRANDIEPEDDDLDPEFTSCPRCGRDKVPFDASTCPWCSLRLTDTKPRWWRAYTSITTDRDPVRARFDDGLPPVSMQDLPPDLYDHVSQRLLNAMFVAADDEDEELADEVGVDTTRKLSEEDAKWVFRNIDEISEEHREEYPVERLVRGDDPSEWDTYSDDE